MSGLWEMSKPKEILAFYWSHKHKHNSSPILSPHSFSYQLLSLLPLNIWYLPLFLLVPSRPHSGSFNAGPDWGSDFLDGLPSLKLMILQSILHILLCIECKTLGAGTMPYISLYCRFNDHISWTEKSRHMIWQVYL